MEGRWRKGKGGGGGGGIPGTLGQRRLNLSLRPDCIVRVLILIAVLVHVTFAIAVTVTITDVNFQLNEFHEEIQSEVGSEISQ